jgi:hypothetical protein
MPKLLIVSENAAEAFHTQQILSEHFSDVRVCNRLDTAKELSSTFVPDLIVASALTAAGYSAADVLRAIPVSDTAGLILTSKIEPVSGEDPKRSVRVFQPLTTANSVEALQKLNLTGIVNQSSLPISLRSPAND